MEWAYLRPAMDADHAGDAIADDLIDAAIDIVADHGFEGLTVKAVTTRVGISLGAFYHHFSSKDDLIETAVSRLAGVSAEAVTRLHAGRMTMAETIREFVGVSLEACREQPARAAFLATAIRSDRWGSVSLDAVRAAAELAGTTDEFSAKYPGLVERLMCGLVQGAYDFIAVHPELADDPRFEEDLVGFAERLVAIES